MSVTMYYGDSPLSIVAILDIPKLVQYVFTIF